MNGGAGPGRRVLLSGSALVALLGLSSLVMLVRGAIPFTSDQAVSLLMALDIRDHGKHPVFYWGVQYAGTFESHLLSILFRLVPDSLAAYRLFLFSLVGATVLLVAATARRAFGARAGFFAGVYLALGPSFFFFKGLTSDGAYTSLLLCLALALYALTRLIDPDLPPQGVLLFSALLGGALGVGWWIHPLVVVFAPLAGAALFTPARRAARAGPLATMASAFLVGSAPWWIKNVQTDFLSLQIQEMSPVARTDAWARLFSLVLDGIPMVLGGRSAWTFPPTVPGGAWLGLGAFVLITGSAVLGLRRDAPEAGRPLAVFGVLLMLGTPAISLVIAHSDFKWDVRYLFPMYLGLAPLAGHLLDRMLAMRRQAGFIAMAALFLVLGPGSQVRSKRFDDYQTNRIPETRAFARDLTARGIDGVYAPYCAYRFQYLSGGKPPASPFGKGDGGVVRSLELLLGEVDRAARPAFVLEPFEADRLRDFLRSRGDGFSTWKVPSLGLEVLTDVPDRIVQILRTTRYGPEIPPPLLR